MVLGVGWMGGGLGGGGLIDNRGSSAKQPKYTAPQNYLRTYLLWRNNCWRPDFADGFHVSVCLCIINNICFKAREDIL